MAKITGTKQIFPTEILTVDTSAVERVGTHGWDEDSKEYIYLQGTASVGVGDWVVYDENFTTTRLTAGEVGPVAVSPTAIVLGEYGWFQIKGVVLANSDDIVADSSLYIDGTAGRVDDLSVSGDLVLGAYSMTAAVSNKATCYITYPHVSNDIGGTGGVVAGADTQVQFNDSGAFAGDGGFTFNKTTDVVTATAFVTNTGTAYSVGGVDVAVADGGTGASTAANARTNLGLAIGTDVQAFDAQLTDVAAVAPASSAFVGSNATNLILRSAAETRGDLGLIIGTNVQAFDAQLTDIAAITPAASAFIGSNATNLIARSAAETRGDLGLIIGTNVQAWDNDLDDLAALAHSGSAHIISNGTDWLSRTVSQVRGDIGINLTANAVVLGNGDNPLTVVSGLGASTQVLTSNGAGTPPTWQAAAGGSTPTASIQAVVYGYNSYVRTGDGQFFIHVDDRLAGLSLRTAHARHVTTLTAGTGTLIDVVNTGTSGTAAAGTAMLSTRILIDAGEAGSNTAVWPAVVSATGSAVLQNDLLRIDIDEAGTTGSARGLIVTLGFK